MTPPRTLQLGDLALTLWGPESDHVLLTVHGKQSHQGDADVMAAVRHALSRGEQALTWDLPGHGVRPGTPDDCRITDAAAELDQVWRWTSDHFGHRRVFATSMGAYLTLLTAPQRMIAEALFLSPLVDMLALVHELMETFGVSEKALQEQRRVRTPVDLLEWDQYAFIRSHSPLEWDVPTRVLRDGQDQLVPPTSIEDFCTRSGAELTVARDAQHYFHSPDDLRALAAWLDG